MLTLFVELDYHLYAFVCCTHPASPIDDQAAGKFLNRFISPAYAPSFKCDVPGHCTLRECLVPASSVSEQGCYVCLHTDCL